MEKESNPLPQAVPSYPYSADDYAGNYVSLHNDKHEYQQQVPPPSAPQSPGILDIIDSHRRQPSHNTAEPPPDYVDAAPGRLALTRDFFSAPLLHVNGGSRHPDLAVTLPDGRPLYSLETDSTLVYHETHIKDLRVPCSLFFIKRKPIQDKPDGHWRYTIEIKGTTSKNSTKLLEIDSDPGMSLGGRNESWSTRLIFRNAFTGELDGLTLVTTQEGLMGKGMGGEVLYEGKKVADIIDKQRSDPSFDIRLYREGIDPLLVVLMVYVMDDRCMGIKRRNRRSRMAGFTGIGKGPGAGLAGLYALGSM